MFTCYNVHNFNIVYVDTLYSAVTSSVTSTTVATITSNVTSELYNITVTCTIHPDSIADQCVVMAMADGGVTRTGNNIILWYVYTHINNVYNAITKF